MPMGTTGANIVDTLAQLGRDRTRVRKGAVRPEITPEQIRGLLGDVATGVGVPFIDAARQAAQGNYGQAAISGLLDAPPVKLAGMALAPLVTAFHGTPHKFTKFDISKVGTGEGAQAYGHGMYFAESPAVARGYAENVKDMSTVAKINQELSRLSKIMDEEKIPGTYRQFKSSVGENAAKQYDNLMSQRENVRSAPGNIYKVDIPDEAVAKMIDWDKPIGQQTEEVQKAIERTKSLLPEGAIDTLGNISNLYGKNITPNEFLNTWEIIGGKNAGENVLLKQGIPGVRYFDAGSRGANGGTRNFVVFDPQIVKILERNNQPITGLLE